MSEARRFGARNSDTSTCTGPKPVALASIFPPPIRLPAGQLFCLACALEQRLAAARPSNFTPFTTLSATERGVLLWFGGTASSVETDPTPAVFGLTVSLAEPAAKATAAKTSRVRPERRRARRIPVRKVRAFMPELFPVPLGSCTASGLGRVPAERVHPAPAAGRPARCERPAGQLVRGVEVLHGVLVVAPARVELGQAE